ncbi:MAG: restriction endonuclease [Rhodobacterales bacterium]|nr:MAG: restriction endonuclease [Rhodobacterales bacterium]
MERRFVIKPEGSPDFPGMMFVTLKALKKLGGSARNQELDEAVVELEGVSEEEQSFMMSGKNSSQPRLNYYLAWARTYLKKADLIENSQRAVWSLTDRGKEHQSLKKLTNLYDSTEKERSKKRRAAQQSQSDPTQNDQPFDAPDEEAATDENWREKLLSVLRAMDPSAFERLSQKLLREAGFIKVEVRGKSGDGGIDGVGVLRMNLVSFQVFFQCKRYKGSVSSGEIRDFRGAMIGRADKGLFITTGTFTAQARSEATRDGASTIDLIDGEAFCDLLKANNLGVATEMIERVSINEAWFGAV